MDSTMLVASPSATWLLMVTSDMGETQMNK